MLVSYPRLQVDIGTRNNFEVSLVAVMGASFKGDIAIDDLSFDDCALQGKSTFLDHRTNVFDNELLTCNTSLTQ